MLFFVWSGITDGYSQGPWQTWLNGQTEYFMILGCFPGSFQPNFTSYFYPTFSFYTVQAQFDSWQSFYLDSPKENSKYSVSFSSLTKGMPDLVDPVEHKKKHIDIRHTHAQVLQANYTDKWVSLQQDCFQLCGPFTAQCEPNDALQSIQPGLEIWKYELLMLLQFSETVLISSFNFVDESEYEQKCRWTQCRLNTKQRDK